MPNKDNLRPIPDLAAPPAGYFLVVPPKDSEADDAIDPGSNRDMYAGLNDEERAALVEVTRFGFPPRTWFAYQRLGYGPLSGLIDEIVEMDPQYFSHDFWNVSLSQPRETSCAQFSRQVFRRSGASGSALMCRGP